MICQTDIRTKILDRVNDEFIKNRPTFKRVSVDTFQVTNTGKATNRRQAYEVAQNLIKRTKELFSGGVQGYISQPSAYEPIQVTFMVTDKLIRQYVELIPPTLFNNGEVVQSKASPRTIQKVKDWLDRSGIQLQNLDTERFGNINGVALTLNKIIQIAEGKEDVAITEEAMHMLTQMVKAGNKTLFNKMMSKITNYQLFTETKDIYQSDPSYMNEDGSPNIPKIKEEAIGKVLAEYYLQQQEDTNGELLSQTKSWLDQIIDWLKKLLHINSNPFTMSIQQMDRLTPTTIDPTTAEQLAKRIQEKATGAVADGINQFIANGDYSSVIGFVGEQLAFYDSYDATIQNVLQGDSQLAEEVLTALGEYKQLPENELFRKFDEKKTKYNLEKVENSNDPDDENNNSYYRVTIDGQPHITDRTTEWAKWENRKKSGGKDFLANATEEEKRYWAKKAMAGTSGHYDLENIISSALNEDGTVKDRSLVVTPIKSSTDPAIYRKFVDYLIGTPDRQGFLYQFPEGSQIRVEQQIYNDTINPKRDGKTFKGRAGTVDVIVSLPNGDIQIYDWKFMGFLLDKPDQSFLKRNQHALQLADYRNTLKQAYGVTGKIEAFTIPIHAQYRDQINPDTKERTPVLVSVTMGNTSLKDEERTPLIPVVPDDQSTGNIQVDDLIRRLRARYKKLYDKKVNDNEWETKIEQLNALSESIRNLQVGINFAPLAIQAENFQQDIQKVINRYKNIDFSTYSPAERKLAINELLELVNSADYYTTIDQTFISQYGSENLSEARSATLASLIKTSSIARDESRKLVDILDNLVMVIAKEEGFDNYLSPETETTGILNSMTEGLLVSNKALSLITKMNLVQASETNIRINKELTKFNELYLNMVKQVGSNPFKVLTKNNKHELFYKIDNQFYKEKSTAFTNKDKEWIKKNINLDEYKKLARIQIDRKISQVDERIYSNDTRINNARKEAEKINIKRSLDIDRTDFNGWDNKSFKYLVSQTLNVEGKESTDYKALTGASKEMYDYIVDFNKYLKEIGYLPKSATLSFLPFIKATTLQRIANTKNPLSTVKKILSDTISVNVNENQQYGKIDEETGEQDRSIPTFFTVDQGENSQDLLRIMSTMIKSAYEFEGAQELEDTFQLIYKVEQNKGHLEIDRRSNRVIMEGDKPRVFPGNTKNSDLVKKNIDDYIYGISQESDTFIDTLAQNRLSGSVEEKQQKGFKIKKAILQGNTLTQQLAVGLKALVAIPNYVGSHFQAIINAGTFFKGREYEINHSKIITSSLQGKEGQLRTALINMIIPLNEDIVKENVRKAAWKQGLSKWIGTWTFNDVMMSSNQIPDKAHQLTNALTWLENTMLDEKGNMVNIRQYVSKQNLGRYFLSQSQRREVEQSMEKEISRLKETKSLPKIAQFDGDILTIPGLNESSLPAYRAKIVEYGRNITGQMSPDNRADYQRNIIARSFMMFKNWIPKQVSVRGLDIHKNPILEEWEYGRTRLFAKTLLHLGYRNISKIRDITRGTDTGLKIMREILEKKQEDYFKKTGQILEISQEEFFDLMRKEIQSEMKELQLLLTIMAMVVAAKLAAPDDEEDPGRLNRYKLFARAINKISDELLFYYNPLSMESITRGTVVPSLGLLTKSYNIMTHTTTEILGVDLSDREIFSDEVREKNKTLKYWFNMVPVASQFQTELLPIISPETAKDLGIRLTVEARATQ